MPKLSESERFWAKVDKNGPPPSHRSELGHCWVWTASTDPYGYGYFWFRGKTMRSSRVAWIIENGALNAKAFICHHCDNPTCVRPSHLFLGDPLVNMADKVSKGRAKGAHKGADHHAAKLDRQKVIDIRERYDNRKLVPVTQRALAEEYGLHQVTISEIVTRKIWSHI